MMDSNHLEQTGLRIFRVIYIFFEYGPYISPVNINDVAIVHIPLFHRFVRLTGADGQGQDIHLRGEAKKPTLFARQLMYG